MFMLNYVLKQPGSDTCSRIMTAILEFNLPAEKVKLPIRFLKKSLIVGKIYNFHEFTS